MTCSQTFCHGIRKHFTSQKLDFLKFFEVWTISFDESYIPFLDYTLKSHEIFYIGKCIQCSVKILVGTSISQELVTDEKIITTQIE